MAGFSQIDAKVEGKAEEHTVGSVTARIIRLLFQKRAREMTLLRSSSLHWAAEPSAFLPLESLDRGGRIPAGFQKPAENYALIGSHGPRDCTVGI